MKTQKGITLIALIITIIVMLILVGVSVSVALNTGLFKTAQGVAKNTQLAANEENTLSTGWITVINATTGKPEQVDINSFGKVESGDEVISLVQEGATATHILNVGNKKFEIDSTTTWQDVIDEVPEITASGVYMYQYGNGNINYPPYNAWLENGYDGTTVMSAFSGGYTIVVGDHERLL